MKENNGFEFKSILDLFSLESKDLCAAQTVRVKIM